MYRIQGADMFDQMVDDIKEDTVRQILSVAPRAQATERVQVAKPTSEGFGGDKSIVRKPVTVNKVGRNDPCPCGSGKKYKKCCGASIAADND
jgi:preprotein translocase subunit SecA